MNVIPRRVSAEFSSNDLLYFEVDVCGVLDEQLKPIAAKIGHATSIVNAYGRRLD